MKTCRNCGNKYNDEMNFCPNCGSPKVITDEEIASQQQQEKEQDLKERTIATRHKKRIIWTAIITVAFLLIITTGVVTAINADYNRTIVVNGVEQLSKAKMDNAYEMGVAYMAQGDLANAIQQFDQVDERSAKYKDAQLRLIECNAQYRDQALEIADAYLQSGDYNSAIEKLDAIYASSPNDSVIMAKKEEILAAQTAYNAELRQKLIAQASVRLQNNDMPSAIAILKDGLAKLPNDAEIQAALDNANTIYKADFLSRVESLIMAGSFTDATALLQTALQIFPSDSELLSKASALQTSNVLGEATAKETQGDLAGAIQLLRNADASIQQNAEVIEMLNRLKANYKEQVVSEASSLYESNGYLAAAQKIQEGIAILQNDTELTEIKANYLNRAPKDLLQSDYLTCKDSYVLGNGKDNLGNQYSSYIALSSLYRVGSMSFKLGKEYSVITGTIFLRYQKRSANETQYVKIYGDDILLYTSSAVTAGIDPINFEISISGVDKIKFETEGDGYNSVGIGNLFVIK